MHKIFSMSIDIVLVEEHGEIDAFYQQTFNNITDISNIPKLISGRIIEMYNLFIASRNTDEVGKLRADISFETVDNSIYDVVSEDKLTQILRGKDVYTLPDEVINEYNKFSKYSLFKDISKFIIKLNTPDIDNNTVTLDATELYHVTDYDKFTTITDIIHSYLYLNKNYRVDTCCIITHEGTTYERELDIKTLFVKRSDVQSREVLYKLFKAVTASSHFISSTNQQE